MRVRHGIFALLITLTACSGKKRPFADGPIEGLGGTSGAAEPAAEQEAEAPSPGAGVTPAVTGGESLGDVPIDMPSPPDDAAQSSANLACEADASACAEPDAGLSPAVCVPTGPRDCTSDVDNDCDGQPDNLLDDVCLCAIDTSEACEEHPGLDGNGPCRAGLRTCVLSADGLTSEWGACEGSAGPRGPDSCTVRGDDSDCDGTPNTDCPCVDGDTQECGSATDTGPCSIGTSTCMNARFGPCVGATPPAAQDSCAPGDDSNCNGRVNDRFCGCLDGTVDECGVTDTGACALGTRTCRNGSFGACEGNVDPRSRDCRAQQDNDCDGRPDNAIDNVCQCIPGQGNGPCRGDPNNSRCNGQGQCAPCQSNADCSLVSDARNSCQSGQCVALLGLGQNCQGAAQCLSGFCRRWFEDLDGDAFGNPDRRVMLCSPAPADDQTSLRTSGALISILRTGGVQYSADPGDCCDLPNDAGRSMYPDTTGFFSLAQTACPEVDPFDYNCSGSLTDLFSNRTTSNSSCALNSDCSALWVGSPPACGATGPAQQCQMSNGLCSLTATTFTVTRLCR